MNRLSIVLTLSAGLLLGALNGNPLPAQAPTAVQTPASVASPVTPENFKLAAAYAAAHGSFAVLVMHDGKIQFEEYQNGKVATDALELASGTKSFWGIAAVAAEEDGLLKLDEKVSETITEWKSDPKREPITIRQLLTLTSGIQGGEIARPPLYDDALNAPLTTEPGVAFHYGPAPFQIFGELMKRKLKDSGQNGVDYLKARILEPIGLDVGVWRSSKDGNPLMPQGAKLTAREWAKFGQLIINGGTWDGKQIVSKSAIDQCFSGTKANPHYGLTFWLKGLDPEEDKDLIPATDSAKPIDRLPDDFVMAAGLGKQRLYIIPSLKLVVVRQGKILGGTFKDAQFLSLLLTGKAREEKALPAVADSQTTDTQRRVLAPGEPGPGFKRRDKNGDGKLTGDEIPELARSKMAQIDTDGDGAISWPEWLKQRNLLISGPSTTEQGSEGAGRQRPRLLDRMRDGGQRPADQQ